MHELILALMLSLVPRDSPARLEPLVSAIEATTTDPEELAVLVTISYYETRFEQAGIPFGLFSLRRRLRAEAWPLSRSASTALELFRRVRRRCGASIAVRLGWYHTGRCRADAYSVRETHTARRLLRLLRHRQRLQGREAARVQRLRRQAPTAGRAP